MILLPPVVLMVWLASLSATPPDANAFVAVGDALISGSSVRWERGSGYVTVRPGAAQARRVRLIRGDKVIIIDTRKMRSHPSQDVKVQPGDIIEPVESFF